MKPRKEISVRISEVSIYDILDCSSPDDLILYAQDLKKSYGDRKIRFVVEPYGYDGGLTVELWETRLENDHEYQARVKAEERAAQARKKQDDKQEERERKEYLRLKKKFEKSQ
jgi:hypothetical protein